MEKLIEGIGLMLMMAGSCLSTEEDKIFALIVGIILVGAVLFFIGYLLEGRVSDDEEDYYI